MTSRFQAKPGKDNSRQLVVTQHRSGQKVDVLDSNSSVVNTKHVYTLHSTHADKVAGWIWMTMDQPGMDWSHWSSTPVSQAVAGAEFLLLL